MKFDWRITSITLTKEIAMTCVFSKAYAIAVLKGWEPQNIQHDVSEDCLRLDVCEEDDGALVVRARVHAWKVQIWQ